jgi:LEA14-like dessication related protein
MKNKNIIIISVVALSLLVFFYYQIKRVLNYTYKITSIRFNTLALQKTSGSLGIEISNNSYISANIDEMFLQIYINNVLVTNLSLKDTATMLAKQSSIFNFNFDFSPNKIFSFQNILQLQNIFDSEKTIIKIQGNMKIKKWLFTFNIPINEQNTLKYYLI